MQNSSRVCTSLLPEPVHPWAARVQAGGALEGGLRRNHARGAGEQ